MKHARKGATDHYHRICRITEEYMCVGVEEVVDQLVLVLAATSCRWSGSAKQQCVHEVHTYGDGTSCTGVLAPRIRLGFRIRPGGGGG